jgi:TetR/AcrR family transcriptional regulator, regulator of cefoperazone and chloramphenicol sensitivity
MRTAPLLQEDLTAKARIREGALRLFSEQGVAQTSVRAVAGAAGVSAGLVIHHFGSKDGLVRAVDEAVVRRITTALGEVPADSPDAQLMARRAEMVAALLRNEPTLCAYIARALAEGTEASGALFHRMFAAASADALLVKAGAIPADTDPFWRAMQQLMLVVGPLILRPLVERELGGSLLSEENFSRWMDANLDLLQRGLYAKS